MTREEAIKIIESNCSCIGSKLREACAMFVPELAESEDERMTRAINNMLPFIPDEAYANNGVTKEGVLNWLEKQKESLHISETCKENANYFTDEDERIRNELYCIVRDNREVGKLLGIKNISCNQALAYLEKQKCDRMKPIYDARESFESALKKAWNDYHNGYENVDKLEDDYVECAHAKGFREGYLFGIEKQKEQKPQFYPGDVIKCTSTGSLWIRCKDRDNIRSDGYTACIGGGFELASEEEAVQFFQELNENGYQWDCIKGRPIKKEQKPVEIHIGNPNIEKIDPNVKITTSNSSASGDELLYVCNKSYKIGYRDGKMDAEQKPAEWSEEDERMRQTAIEACKTVAEDYEYSNTRFYKCKDWLEYRLKSLRPQSKQNARGLAVSFMHYLDEIRPEDKMCLSNGECEDIELAFQDMDWAKIMRYMQKYSPHWKPSEEQMKALQNAVALTACDKELARLYNQLEKL